MRDDDFVDMVRSGKLFADFERDGRRAFQARVGRVGPGEFSAQVSKPSRRVPRARLTGERVVRHRTVSDSPVGATTVSSRAQNRGTRLLRALGEHDVRIRLDSSTRLALSRHRFPHARARRAGEFMDPVPTSGRVLRARRTRRCRVVRVHGDSSLHRRRLYVDEKFCRSPRVDVASPRRRSQRRPTARLHLGPPSRVRRLSRLRVLARRPGVPKANLRRLARVRGRRRRVICRVVRLISHPRAVDATEIGVEVVAFSFSRSRPTSDGSKPEKY